MADAAADVPPRASVSNPNLPSPSAPSPIALPWNYMPTVPVTELTHFCEAILEGAGVPRHKAEVTAACLISANLRGVDSHGIQLLPFYVDQLVAGEMNAQTDGRV